MREGLRLLWLCGLLVLALCADLAWGAELVGERSDGNQEVYSHATIDEDSVDLTLLNVSGRSALGEVAATSATVTGSLDVQTGFNSGGPADFDSTIATTGTATIGGALTVESTSNLQGAVDCDSTFNADGVATFGANVTVGGDVDLTGGTRKITSTAGRLELISNTSYIHLKAAAGAHQYNDIGGLWYWRDIDDGSGGRMALNSANGILYLYDSSEVNQIRLIPGGDSFIRNGDLGIRDTTPDATLDVAGDGIYDQGLTINETGVDADFRVEGDFEPDLLRTDAANDQVLIGDTTGEARFHVYGDVDGTPEAMFDHSTLATDNAEVVIRSGATGNTQVSFGDTADDDAGFLDYDHDDDTLAIGVATNEVVTINDEEEVILSDSLEVATTISVGSTVTINSWLLELDDWGQGSPLTLDPPMLSTYLLTTVGEMAAVDCYGNLSTLTPHDRAANEDVHRTVNLFTGVEQTIWLGRIARELARQTGRDDLITTRVVLAAADRPDWDARNARQLPKRRREVRARWAQGRQVQVPLREAYEWTTASVAMESTTETVALRDALTTDVLALDISGLSASSTTWTQPMKLVEGVFEGPTTGTYYRIVPAPREWITSSVDEVEVVWDGDEPSTRTVTRTVREERVQRRVVERRTLKRGVRFDKGTGKCWRKALPADCPKAFVEERVVELKRPAWLAEPTTIRR